MSVQITPAILHGWRGYKLSCGDIDVGIAPQIGGRIISFMLSGEELLFVQAERAGEHFDFSQIENLRQEKTSIGFGLWGGDKTWIAPQRNWVDDIPPLELDAGPYTSEIDGNAVIMISPLCRETGLRIIRRVELTDNGTMILDEILRNDSDHEIRRGLWNVTQVLRPFDVYLPIDSVRPYPEEGDSVCSLEHFVSREDEWTRIACRQGAHFKYGGFAPCGVVLALREEFGATLAFARTFNHPPNAEYAHGSEVEVYNSPNYNYLEIEVHAPLKTMAPGESISQRQTWYAAVLTGRPNPDAVIQELVESSFA